MENLLGWVQIISGILLVLFILLQEKGSGLGEALTGQTSTSIQSQMRGPEKWVAYLTVLLAVLFAGVSLVLNFV